MDDPRLKYYLPEKGRTDVLLLDALSSGDVFDTLNAAREGLGEDGIIYISDTMRKPEVPGPDVRAVHQQNLDKWLDRTGLKFAGVPMLEDGRIYAKAVKE